MRKEHEDNKMDEHSRRSKRAVIYLICTFLIYIGLSVISIVFIDVFLEIYISATIVFVVMLIVGEQVLHIGRCPYCERSIGRGAFFHTTYCPHCGGRLQ